MKAITLLSDTRNDVLKKLGDPVNGERENHLWYYDFDEGRMSISYTTGICGSFETEVLGWKVPEWRVEQVGFSFDNDTEPKELGISFKGFDSSPIDDVPGGIDYTNDDLGVDYTVNKGKIHDITFRPAKKFGYLQCTQADLKKQN
jgi:hypothetical protein